MKANETRFQPMIEGTKQYIVPLFQRSYSWGKKEWETLWSDLVDLCEGGDSKSHFIGSIVTMPTITVPEGVSKFLLIDGQQRLTTIFILLALLRDVARKNGEDEIADEIRSTMLVNPWKKGNDYFKLMPTQVDRTTFKRLMGESELDGMSQLAKCYQFFAVKLGREGIEVQTLSRAITNRLSVVSIVLERDDNPHLVFESLNAKGRPLTQADLIRNYFFMRIHVDEQEEIHATCWDPMQRQLGDNLTEFIRHYLMRNGGVVKEAEVYYTLKDRVGDGDALAVLRQIGIFAGYYYKLLDPDQEPNTEIRRSLARINRLEVTTAYPFLLNCYDDYSQGRISVEEFVRVVQIIENYIIRRFVCNVPTNTLNKIFPMLYEQAHLAAPSSLAEGVGLTLQTRGYPKDADFRRQLVEAKLYGAGDRGRKTKLILESLELEYGHKEGVRFEDLSVEHVMPQTLTEWWQNHLGENWMADYELCLHTLGNLTLTAYNPELSNGTFPQKRQSFASSHLELNRYFQNQLSWTRKEIEGRSRSLAGRAEMIWPYFGSEQLPSVTTDIVTGKKPRVLTILGQQLTVDTWRDVLTQTMNTIAELEPDMFAELAGQYPRFLSLDASRFRRSHQLHNGWYMEVNLASKDIYRFCTQAIESVGLSVEDWIVETV